MAPSSYTSFAKPSACSALCLFGALICANVGVEAISPQETSKQTITTVAPAKDQGQSFQAQPALTDVLAVAYGYAQQDLLWSESGRPLPAVAEALALLASSDAHGLPNEIYNLEELKRLASSLTTLESAQQFDQALTEALWNYSLHLTQGFTAVGPYAIKTAGKRISQNAELRRNSLIRGMVGAIKRNRIGNYFRAIAPRSDDYKALQRALVTYKNYQAQGGWTALSAEEPLALRSTGSDVRALRARLELTDTLAPNSDQPALFDSGLEQAVKRFQSRHGIEADGVVGGKTMHALNESVATKIDRLALNLDRWRQLPRNLPSDRVMVNIPEYKLRLFQDQEKTLEMRVVVGSTKNPTPVIHGRLDHLVFNPYWYPTNRITRREILPSVLKDPAYLTRTNMEIFHGKQSIDATTINWEEFTEKRFPYRFRQLPGPTNSLGDVKFIFPNKHSVYMHDTPQRSQFNEDQRAYSHGCIRLEKPKELASAILGRERGWNLADIDQKMQGDRPKYTKMRETLDIYLVYLTASAKDGDVFFYSDIYGHDQFPTQLLASRSVHRTLNGLTNRDSAQTALRVAGGP